MKTVLYKQTCQWFLDFARVVFFLFLIRKKCIFYLRRIMKRIFILILTSLMLLVACSTTTKATPESKKLFSEEKQQSKKLFKGNGVTIAVTAPQSREVEQKDAWIPQYMQDSLTGNFARYSKMTVLDRSNESLIKAEQKLSESGFYTDENAAQIGQMTNASLVVVGSVQIVGGMYEMNFRVNDVNTNEIKSSANNRYSKTDIESGKAVNELTEKLLEGLGIEFSESEKAYLSKVYKTEDSSVQNLAKGMAAEKANDYITALVSYNQVDGTSKKEAESNIHSLFYGSFDAANIQNRIAFYQKQIEKWNLIFFQLGKYMNNNAVFFVYDFSSVKDNIDMERKKVLFTVSPGIKLFLNQIAMQVYIEVIKAWKEIVLDDGNSVWTKSVNTDCNYSYSTFVDLGLFNGDGDLIAKKAVSVGTGYSVYNSDYGKFYNDRIIVKSQKKYYDENRYEPIEFYNVNFDDIVGNLTVKIIDDKIKIKMYERANLNADYEEIYKEPARIFSATEWNSFIENQMTKQNARAF